MAVAALVVVSGCGGGGGAGGTTVSGFVYDDSTLGGVSGAQVSVGGKSTTTSASGAFTLTSVPVGTRTLVVTKTSYQLLSTSFTAVAGATGLGPVYLRPQLTPGKGVVIGTVQDAGVPVPGAAVIGGGKTAVTKSDGTFAIYSLPPGDTVVTAQSGVKLGRNHVIVVQDTTVSVSVGLSFSPPLPPTI